MTPETNFQLLALSDLPAVGQPLRGGAFAGIGRLAALEARLWAAA